MKPSLPHRLLPIALALALASCVSTPDTTEKSAAFESAKSLSALSGAHEVENDAWGFKTIEYPFTADTVHGGQTFLKLASEKRDDTALWVDFGVSKGLSLSQLWERRISYIKEIYPSYKIPASDANGSERGMKVTFEDGAVLSQDIVLLTEKIAMSNLDSFLVSSDGKSISIDAESELQFFSEFDSEQAEKHLSGEVGIVLSGGGGKGAYEVGVWKALIEYGVTERVTALSGTSVGGLNSALFSTTALPQIESLWKTVVPSELTKDDKLISQKGLSAILDAMDFAPLWENEYPKVFVTALKSSFLPLKLITSSFSSTPGKYASRFLLNDERNVSELKKKLLATSAFPVLTDPIVLSDGAKYIDGGAEQFGGDNTPIDPIVDNVRWIDEIIVVYLDSTPARRIRKIDYDTKFILEIIPTIDLGGILEGTANFDSSRISLLMNQGYYDTVKILLDDLKLRPISRFWAK